jgi:DNA (cytosine-5)-methyltransferase 1
MIYNEIEPYAARWLGNLSAAGHIAPGTVDTRSIAELKANDVRDHAQAHFFAGIGVWSYALRAAGWSDDRPVWTGSCPCQPFSTAGRAKGFDDKRHLWPEWFRLIRECRPPVILGEQVASPDGLRWLDLVSSDLEREGYAFGAADLCAAGVGAPHIRQRLYFVAYADRQRLDGIDAHLLAGEPRQANVEACGGGEVGGLADRSSNGRRQGGADGRRVQDGTGQTRVARGGPSDHGALGELGNAYDARPQERPGPAIGRGAVRDEGQATPETGTSGFWSPAEWLPCQDRRHRPVEPGTFPLAHGVANRVGKLRAYGNALCAPVAITFIRAVMQTIGEQYG